MNAYIAPEVFHVHDSEQPNVSAYLYLVTLFPNKIAIIPNPEAVV